MMTRPTITYVEQRNSRSYRVVLSCGHRRTVRKRDFDREQWFIGKAIDCPFCTSQENSELLLLKPSRRQSDRNDSFLDQGGRHLAAAQIKIVICGVEESIKVLENYKDQLAAQAAKLES